MAEFLDRIAPLNNAQKITKPLFVVQGANDPRVPKSEALQIVEALKANGAPHEYHEYANEGHGFSRIENRIDSLERTADWLTKYLTPLMDRYLSDPA
jgi:dipeptidyl aminopeptidase/acylaminoacyl peptidase